MQVPVQHAIPVHQRIPLGILLRVWMCSSRILLQVVTGVGRHSIGGRARILPAVVRYLTEAGYRFEENKHNAGVLDVVISRAVSGYQAESGPELNASSADEEF